MKFYVIATFLFNLMQAYVALEIMREEPDRDSMKWAVISFGLFVIWGGIMIFV